MTPPKTPRDSNKFQSAVDYVAGYSYVKGAVLADGDGMVIAKSGKDGLNEELYAATALEVVKALNLKIGKMVSSGTEYVTIKTNREWVTVAQISSFFLIVGAVRHADDLLNIRITRALEMISLHLKNKYPAVIKSEKPGDRKSRKKMEEINV